MDRGLRFKPDLTWQRLATDAVGNANGSLEPDERYCASTTDAGTYSARWGSLVLVGSAETLRLAGYELSGDRLSGELAGERVVYRRLPVMREAEACPIASPGAGQ